MSQRGCRYQFVTRIVENGLSHNYDCFKHVQGGLRLDVNMKENLNHISVMVNILNAAFQFW
jgi:hypothetical protein